MQGRENSGQRLRSNPTKLLKGRIFFIFALAVLLGLTAYHLIITLPCAPNLTDEGYLLAGVDRTLAGQLPGADFHAYAPGRYFSLSLLFKAFGRNMLVERGFWLVLRLACVILVFFLIQKNLGALCAVLLSLPMVLAPGPWHKTLIPFLGLLTLWTLTRAANSDRAATISGCDSRPPRSKYWIWLLSGLVLGVTAVFRIDLFVFTFISWIAVLVSLHAGQSRWRILLASLAGLFIPIAPLALHYSWHGKAKAALTFYFSEITGAASGGINPFLQSNNPLGLIASGHQPKVVVGLLALLIAAMALAGIFVVGVFFIRRRPKPDLLPPVILGAYAAAITWSQPDMPHALQVLPLIGVLAAYLISLFRVWRPSRMAYLYAGIVFGLVVSITWTTPNSYGTGSFRMCPVDGRRLKIATAPLIDDAGHASEIERIVTIIKNHRSDAGTIFVVPYLPLYYFLAEKKNPSGRDALLPHTVGTTRKQEDIIASVKRAMPDLVVADRRSLPDKGVEPRGTTLRQYAPRMYRFLQKNYTPLCRESEVVLLRKRKDLVTHATALPGQCSDVIQSQRFAMTEEPVARGGAR